MWMTWQGQTAGLALASLLVGCASTSPDAAFRDVSRAAEQRVGHPLRWSRGTAEDREVEALVRDLLGRELTVDQAVQVALLNNRSLVATYEELSISQADLVQAGLLKNPSFRAGMTTAEADRLDPNLVLGVSWDFLHVFMLPAKKKIADLQQFVDRFGSHGHLSRDPDGRKRYAFIHGNWFMYNNAMHAARCSPERVAVSFRHEY